ncbi:hypothetical protein ACNR9Q_12350 [Maribacter sp. X9]|uniref:hypothetical protein n=1 Tax=Maribacter sp. X9 TaxID=3402159 RepID=UPI003AF34296
MDRQELIEKYLAGKLSSEEAVHFETLIQKDMEFRDEVVFFERVKKAAKEHDQKLFKKKLQNFDVEKPVLKPKRYWTIAIAASVALLMGIYLYNISQPIDPNSLFSEYFKPAQNVSLPLVRNEGEDTLALAFSAYEQNTYSQALKLFDELDPDKTPAWIGYYKGSALLALDRTEEAIKVLEQHVASGDSLALRSHWFLALAYLKKGNYKKTKEELSMLKGSKDSFKQEESKELMARISKSLPSP